LLGVLASSLTARSAEIKAATEKRIEPNTKSSSPRRYCVWVIVRK